MANPAIDTPPFLGRMTVSYRTLTCVAGDDDRDGCGDDNAGQFRVGFSCVDGVHPDPTMTATLNGVPVSNGQIVSLELVDDGQEVGWYDGILEIQAPSFELVDICTDAWGNVAAASAIPVFPPDDDDGP